MRLGRADLVIACNFRMILALYKKGNIISVMQSHWGSSVEFQVPWLCLWALSGRTDGRTESFDHSQSLAAFHLVYTFEDR
jgi:hypothetical protein